ncbi:MAG: hypothetical protein F6K58_25075 [Symploca sp. SIO2E9]|nr:hypothetical protein [Symploca sp. SIO2E9]
MGRGGDGGKILMVIFPSKLDNLFLGFPLHKSELHPTSFKRGTSAAGI